MIRFGVVLSVVLAAIGLLGAGVVAGSLVLVVASVGVAGLGCLMLIAAVLFWRREIFSARATDYPVGGAHEPGLALAAGVSGPARAQATGHRDAKQSGVVADAPRVGAAAPLAASEDVISAAR